LAANTNKTIYMYIHDVSTAMRWLTAAADYSLDRNTATTHAWVYM